MGETDSPRLETTLLRWRRRALDYVSLTAVAAGAVPLLGMFLIDPGSLSPGLRLSVLGVYFLVAGVAAARRLDHQVRAGLFLLALFVLAALMLAARGLEGHGRIVLVMLPLYATVLLGPRSGYVAGGVGLATFAAAAVWHGAGGAWLLQGLLLALALWLTLVLVNQFVGLLRGALETERDAVRRVTDAEGERRRLERALLQTGGERQDVGYQLHDGPCQRLTAALLRCQVARNSLAARGAGEEVARLDAISAMLDAAMGEIYELARGLSPAALSPDALPSALEDLAKSVRGAGTAVCEFLHDGAARPGDPETASQLFRVAQEAVAHAVRHGRARRVEIELDHNDGLLRLVVRDDGVGLPAEPDRGGMGLRIMRYRAERAGGALSLGPPAGGGTVVACTVPVTGAAARPEAAA
jgi:signal transduction histidine kinase